MGDLFHPLTQPFNSNQSSVDESLNQLEEVEPLGILMRIFCDWPMKNFYKLR